MHIFFQNNQYLGSYYFTRSADDPVDTSEYKNICHLTKNISPLQAVCGGSVEGLVQKNRLSSTSSKDSGHSGGSMDRASTGSEQSQDHE